ncbi:MAG: FtsX-like permease family protein [Acidimicrobiales bacterium]|nr:FtsX-like permease family protein [Acidimicrobiales bacterium]
MARVYLYRLRSILRRRSSDYLVLALLIAVLGGLAMGSVVVGRRTQSAFPAFLAQDKASTLTMSTYGTGPNEVANDYLPSVEAAIRRLPEVQSVEAMAGAFAVPIQSDGAPLGSAYNTINIAASIDGLYFDQDRAVVVKGRMANPDAPDEFVTTPLGAQILGLHLGQDLLFGVFNTQLAQEPGFGTPAVQPLSKVKMRLVGLVEFNYQVIEDDTDRFPTNLILTPAFTRSQVNDNGTWYGIRLRPGVRDLGSLERKLIALLPPGSVPNFDPVSAVGDRVETAVRPESIALAGFGLIAALAAFGICIPVMSRLTMNGDDERRVLRALGAAPRSVAADTYIGAVAALALGTVLATGISAGLSTLAPLGPVHRVYHPGPLALDWTVVGISALLFTGVLGAVVVAMATRRARGGAGHLHPASAGAKSGVASAAVAAGLPVPIVLGTRFALEPGRGRTAVPARSVIGGAMLSVALVVTTLTFASGLRTLVSRPALYGWNWDYALISQNVVPPQARTALNNDRLVRAWSGYTDVGLVIDGQVVPAIGAENTAVVGPPVLSGHQVTGANQVVLGSATLTSLGKKVGDLVQVAYGSPSTAPIYLPPRPMRIVGTATFPAISGSNNIAEHPSLGVGALFSYLSLPAAFLNLLQVPDPTQDGPPVVFVRFQAGVGAKAAKADLDRIVAVANQAFATDPAAATDTDSWESVQRPAAIANYQSTGATPLILACSLAASAMAALAISLVASVRRRRRDLAVLKTLGFTRAQTTATVAAQALVTALLADAVGIPVGIAVGRQLWIAFARSIDAVPTPTVPASVALVGMLTVVISLLVAVVPGRLAARTPAAAVLRVE